MTCSICFDEMDMILFNDPRESTTTCVKLSCGHAFHTKCIITCLEVMDHKCPLCNIRKTPETSLTEKGIVIRAIKEIRKLPKIRELVNERNVAKDQVLRTMKNLRNQIDEFAQQKAKELNLFEQRAYFIRCNRLSLSAAKSEASHLKPLFTGVMEVHKSRYGHFNSIEKNLFGGNACRYEWKIMHPRCYISIKNLKEK